MADSMPMRAAPPSSTGSASPNSSATCAAVVGLTRPKRFALGAAMPATPASPAPREQGVGDRMRRAAQADRRLAGGGGGGDAGPARDDHRQRPGPERLDRVARDRRQRRAKRSAPAAVGDVDDQRVPGRPPLEREDLGDRLVAVGARAEAVHGLGRKRDQLAGGDQRGGLRRSRRRRRPSSRIAAPPGHARRGRAGRARPAAPPRHAPRPRRRSPR